MELSVMKLFDLKSDNVNFRLKSFYMTLYLLKWNNSIFFNLFQRFFKITLL